MLGNELSRINYIVTENCNLNCSFCFQNQVCRSNKQLTDNEIIKFTKFILKHYKKDEGNILTLNIIGGEPMLFKDYSIFKTVLDMYKDKEVKIDEITIFSNGILLTDSFLNFLSYACKNIEKVDFNSTSNICDEYPNRIIKKEHLNNYYNNLNIIRKKFPTVNIQSSIIFDKSIINNYKDILIHQFDNINNYIPLTISEYVSENKNLTENDFYEMTKIFFALVKKYNLNIYDESFFEYISASGLMYLNILLFKKQNKILTSCRPLVKEFGIAPEGYMCSCSRALAHKKDFPNINDNEDKIIEKIKKYKADMERQFENEEGNSCLNCFLNNYCIQCKILPHKYIEKDGIFFMPIEKCKYQLNQFNGQYKALKEFLEEEKNNGESTP